MDVITHNSLIVAQIASYPTLRKSSITQCNDLGPFVGKQIRTCTHDKMMVCPETYVEGASVFVGSRQAFQLFLKWNLTWFLSISKAKLLLFIGYLSTVVVQKQDTCKNKCLCFESSLVIYRIHLKKHTFIESMPRSIVLIITFLCSMISIQLLYIHNGLWDTVDIFS